MKILYTLFRIFILNIIILAIFLFLLMCLTKTCYGKELYDPVEIVDKVPCKLIKVECKWLSKLVK